MIRFGDGSKYMSMKYDAAGRLLRRTTRVPFRDIAVGGKLQLESVRADLTTLRSGIVARNVAAASATSTAGSSSACSSAPSTSLLAGSSGASVATIKGKVSKRAFGMTDYDYCGNVEYTNDKAVLYHSEGYVTFDKNQQPEFHYYLKDHLGNVRVVVNERDSVEQVTHYYPFGGSFGDGVGSSVQDYLYSGKELTRFNALNWYNYGARWYDPAILHWNGVDKLAEKFVNSSPFLYCHNDPINRIDPNGMDDYYTINGDFVKHIENGTDSIMINWQIEVGEPDSPGFFVIDGGIPIQYITLAPEAYGNIFTDIINKMDDASTDELTGKKVSVMVWHTDANSNLGVYGEGFNNANNKFNTLSDIREVDGNNNVTAYIYPKDTNERNLYTTISNVQNLLGVHEILGHGKMGLKHTFGKHDEVYLFQKSHKSWNKTTKNFKEYEAEIYNKR